MYSMFFFHLDMFICILQIYTYKTYCTLEHLDIVQYIYIHVYISILYVYILYTYIIHLNIYGILKDI